MNLNCWQKNIDDGKDIMTINTAGTHDSVTQYVQFSYMAKCQSLNIYEQLCLGVRALDLRVDERGGRLVMVHSVAKVFNTPNHFSRQMDMADVLEHCYRFLAENPSEAIIFQFKNDNGRHMEQCFDLLFNQYISKNESKWFTENRIPLMGEARGKIILVRRCKMSEQPEYTPFNTGIDFSSWREQDKIIPTPLSLNTGGDMSAEFVILDRFKYRPEPRWNECVKPFLDKCTEFNGKYIISYLSTAGGFKGPKRNSDYINSRFLKYELKKGTYYGMIYMDFPTEQLVEKIIKTNF